MAGSMAAKAGRHPKVDRLGSIYEPLKLSILQRDDEPLWEKLDRYYRAVQMNLMYHIDSSVSIKGAVVVGEHCQGTLEQECAHGIQMNGKELVALKDVENKCFLTFALPVCLYLVKTTILNYQSPTTGLFPVKTCSTCKEAKVRDSLYCAASAWALALAYRRIDDDMGRTHELEHSAVKCMRGILYCYMRQADKVSFSRPSISFCFQSAHRPPAAQDCCSDRK
ncbi:Phosphorylase b kinase regulatory subunit beta [Takifugu flavidus]|uniref:Phosphorylase b kinase regulatory subunit n=1 Tax=Takifugu flavidus TaxID=433684 RepID=A0A5C6NLX5_9TELE|nr:Phosphorylase b kinase regulatory subunit beta [Takifugu flavidus]